MTRFALPLGIFIGVCVWRISYSNGRANSCQYSHDSPPSPALVGQRKFARSPLSGMAVESRFTLESNLFNSEKQFHP
ncbi:hypothetical protein [Pseudomonas sp. JUb96]|uniref:hypothetical protein n=1 Tax=Pseudomonas sp. JUb96 TaxID=2940539 RepID=UPI0022273E04|nr:hypothetical protein [Pseudomonas sp. JUb96]MCW2270766.1 hypothetical protein [Pseudomonas sp. JUb96]